MSQKPRRNFTAEQKAEAVRIVHQYGKSVNQVAKEMGLTPSALRNGSVAKNLKNAIRSVEVHIIQHYQ